MESARLAPALNEIETTAASAARRSSSAAAARGDGAVGNERERIVAIAFA